MSSPRRICEYCHTVNTRAGSCIACGAPLPKVSRPKPKPRPKLAPAPDMTLETVRKGGEEVD